MTKSLHTRGFTLIELMIVVVIIGVLASIAIPNFVRMMVNAKEAAVKSNCHTVQITAEDFAVQAGGVYPGSVADTTPGGDTMVDMLPMNVLLLNPFDKLRTQPVDGEAGVAGDSGYEPLVDATGTNVGYRITGFGKSRLVIELRSGNI